MARYLLHRLGEQIAQQPLRIGKHSPPSLLQCHTQAPITLLAFELALCFLQCCAANQPIAVEEAMDGRCCVRGVLFAEVDTEKPALLPARSSHRQVQPPDETIREHRKRYALVKGVAQQLLLVLAEVRAGALHLDQHEIARVSPEAVVHPPAENRVLTGNLVRIKRVPAECTNDGIHRHLARSLLTALREIDRSQPREQRFDVRQLRHSAESTA